MKHKNFSPHILALVAVLGFVLFSGANAAMTKIAVKEIPSFSFTFLRFLLASLCILPFFLRSKPKLHKDFYKVVVFSLLLSINVTLFPLGTALTTATIAGTLYIVTPIIIALLSYFLLAERFSQRKILGVIIGFVGSLLIILLPVFAKGEPFSGNLLGNCIIFIAAISTALYTVLSKPFQKEYSPQQLTSIFIFTTCFALFFFALSDLVTHPLWWQQVSSKAISSTIYVSILGTVVAYILYQYAIKHGSPLIASMSLYIGPISAYMWAAVLLEEQLTAGLVIGSILAFIGVYLTIKTRN